MHKVIMLVINNYFLDIYAQKHLGVKWKITKHLTWKKIAVSQFQEKHGARVEEILLFITKPTKKLLETADHRFQMEKQKNKTTKKWCGVEKVMRKFKQI